VDLHLIAVTLARKKLLARLATDIIHYRGWGHATNPHSTILTISHQSKGPYF
jgi:hypothetical protein